MKDAKQRMGFMLKYEGLRTMYEMRMENPETRHEKQSLQELIEANQETGKTKADGSPIDLVDLMSDLIRKGYKSKKECDYDSEYYESDYYYSEGDDDDGEDDDSDEDGEEPEEEDEEYGEETTDDVTTVAGESVAGGTAGEEQ